MSLLPAALAFFFWLLTCIRWFDDGAPFRPSWLAALPPAPLALATLAALVAWLRGRSGALLGPGAAPSGALVLVLALTFFFRLPMAWWGAAGHLTSDGSLSGLMAVHLRDGIDHPVFVPNVGYSGSLKSHVTVLLALFTDMPRAFALASVLFYGLFAAAVYRLGALVGTVADGGARVGLHAGLYAAFAPAWVTHYSLSNDGNYIEALAFGTWSLFFATLWISEREHRTTRAALIGLLVGLGFWCHILIVLYAVTAALVMVVFGRRDALRAVPFAALGFVSGNLPALLWNVQNDGFSFGYLTTGAHQDRPVDAFASATRILPMVTDHWPILLGYDAGLASPFARVSLVLAWGAVVATVLAVVMMLARVHRQPAGVLTVLLVFTATNVGLALAGTEHIPGNPRYLLFLMTPIPVFVAVAFGGRWRPVLAAIIAFGALGSAATFPPNVEADARWRGFVAALQREGVHWCHTDYYLAAKINFLSEERVLCSSRLGPTKADYFRYADRVDPAPTVDLIPINRTRAQRIELRLQELGVRYERLDLMKPVLLRLSRKVDPDELPPLPQLPAASTLR